MLAFSYKNSNSFVKNKLNFYKFRIVKLKLITAKVLGTCTLFLIIRTK